VSKLIKAMSHGFVTTLDNTCQATVVYMKCTCQKERTATAMLILNLADTPRERERERERWFTDRDGFE